MFSKCRLATTSNQAVTWQPVFRESHDANCLIYVATVSYNLRNRQIAVNQKFPEKLAGDWANQLKKKVVFIFSSFLKWRRQKWGNSEANEKWVCLQQVWQGYSSRSIQILVFFRVFWRHRYTLGSSPPGNHCKPVKKVSWLFQYVHYGKKNRRSDKRKKRPL